MAVCSAFAAMVVLLLALLVLLRATGVINAVPGAAGRDMLGRVRAPRVGPDTTLLITVSAA